MAFSSRRFALALIVSAISFMTVEAVASDRFDEFNSNFSDTTLRLDYVFGGSVPGGKAECSIMLDRLSKQPRWAGLRHRMTELPLEGNGQITVSDAATGSPLYRTSFSTLFQEWLTTDEASSVAKAFENTFLIPMPRREATVRVELLDSRRRPMAVMTHTVNPSDILIADQSAVPATPHRYLHRGADPEEAIDVAILAEGYTVAEMDSFYRHAQTAVDEILSYKPFSDHAGKFNFVAVAAPSAESGVSIPRLNDWRDTAVSSNFSTFYSDRYLTTGHVKALHDLLVNIPYEHIIILANTEEYGGGGIYNSYTLTTARHATFRPVVVHEFGHSFGGLADEYFYENDDISTSDYHEGVEPWEPNITTRADFASKWASMMPEGTPVPTDPKDAEKYPVGLYEGGGYVSKGVYRPANECRMRNNTYPTFCPVCTAALDRLILFYTE